VVQPPNSVMGQPVNLEVVVIMVELVDVDGNRVTTMGAGLSPDVAQSVVAAKLVPADPVRGTPPEPVQTVATAPVQAVASA
jgi:hypothetical protein